MPHAIFLGAIDLYSLNPRQMDRSNQSPVRAEIKGRRVLNIW